LINIPGGPSAAATLLEGHPMAKRGEGARALGIGIIASFVGGLFSFFCLSLFAPQLASVALHFKTPELFALVFFGLSIISSFSVQSVAKGLLSAVLGLIFCTIGQDPIRGIGRFTFDSPDLLMGFHLIPALVGIFAFPELVNTLREESPSLQHVEADLPLRKVLPSWEDMKTCRIPTLIGSAVGTFIGFLPGAGGPIAVFMAYDYTRKVSKRPEKFGTGIPEGIAATESANSAVTGGALIPTMTLGIPGDGITAIMLGALMIHGLAPGPLLFVQNAAFAYTMIATFFCAIFSTALIALLGVKWIVKLLATPRSLMMPAILICCFVGAYAPRNSMFDVFSMFGFGLLGVAFRWLHIPAIPLVLAVVLGQQFETHLRLALTSSEGNVLIFVSSPLSVFLLALSAFTILWPFLLEWRQKRRGDAGAA
jgi:putative tricarboxylic transport membrane protein